MTASIIIPHHPWLATLPMLRYTAFISRRRTDPDVGFAVWLHRRLERHRIPRGVVEAHGLSSCRIGDCSLDDEELSAATHVGEALERGRGTRNSCVRPGMIRRRSGFASDDQRLERWSHLTPEWKRATPLRTDLSRRQALVELDALAALAMGISEDDLLLIYRVQFPVLQQYERDNRYDQRGMLVPEALLKAVSRDPGHPVAPYVPPSPIMTAAKTCLPPTATSPSSARPPS